MGSLFLEWFVACDLLGLLREDADELGRGAFAASVVGVGARLDLAPGLGLGIDGIAQGLADALVGLSAEGHGKARSDLDRGLKVLFGGDAFQVPGLVFDAGIAFDVYGVGFVFIREVVEALSETMFH